MELKQLEQIAEFARKQVGDFMYPVDKGADEDCDDYLCPLLNWCCTKGAAREPDRIRGALVLHYWWKKPSKMLACEWIRQVGTGEVVDKTLSNLLYPGTDWRKHLDVGGDWVALNAVWGIPRQPELLDPTKNKKDAGCFTRAQYKAALPVWAQVLAMFSKLEVILFTGSWAKPGWNGDCSRTVKDEGKLDAKIRLEETSHPSQWQQWQWLTIQPHLYVSTPISQF
jgi:hypothetical protein